MSYYALHKGFTFPPLGDTGAGKPVLWRGSVWSLPSDPSYAVSRQGDVPACAYRCHYPGGSSPCDLETALEYIAYVVEGALR